MSYGSQRNRMLASNAIFAGLGLGLIALVTSPAMAQEHAADPEFPDLAPIMDSVARLRGLKFTEPVPAETQDQAGWGAFLADEIDKAYPADVREGMVKGLVKLGLLEEHLDIAEQLQTALLTQAGAYYNTETGRFYYLMVDMPEAELALLASHELTHALQDQHFDLDSLMEIAEEANSDVRNDDAMLAFTSLVEGEATYLMMVWQADQAGRDLAENHRREAAAFSMMSEMNMDVMVTMAQAAGVAYGEESDIGRALDAMDDIPMYILEPLYASYMKGAFYVMSMRQAGGWDAVSEAYSDMPRSTEQILHPEKYIGGEDGSLRDNPSSIRLPEFALLAEHGYKKIDEAVHGELYLEMLLRNLGLNVYEADIAAEGWDADVYRAFETPNGDTAIVLATTWDTESDAEEFAVAYQKALATKYPEVPIREQETDQVQRADAGSEQDYQGTVIRRGHDVFAVEGISHEVVDAVLAKLLETEIERVR